MLVLTPTFCKSKEKIKEIIRIHFPYISIHTSQQKWYTSSQKKNSISILYYYNVVICFGTISLFICDVKISFANLYEAVTVYSDRTNVRNSLLWRSLAKIKKCGAETNKNYFQRIKCSHSFYIQHKHLNCF